MIVSIIVRARIKASLAPFIDPLTADTICLFVPIAMNLGRLAAAVAACSAAWQLVSKLSLASDTASWAEARESWRRKATKRSDNIGYASQVRLRRMKIQYVELHDMRRYTLEYMGA